MVTPTAGAPSTPVQDADAAGGVRGAGYSCGTRISVVLLSSTSGVTFDQSDWRFPVPANAATSPIPPAARAELTPTGKLRAGINFQNQFLTTLGPNGEQGGVAVEFSRELARRLGVPLEIVSYKSAGALADSVTDGAWEISVLGDEPERAKVIAFAPPLTELEATYLVPPGSSIRSVDEVDHPGVRIVSPAKSAYDLYLSRTIRHAQLVQVAGGK